MMKLKYARLCFALNSVLFSSMPYVSGFVPKTKLLNNFVQAAGTSHSRWMQSNHDSELRRRFSTTSIPLSLQDELKNLSLEDNRKEFSSLLVSHNTKRAITEGLNYR
jgi:hypothetical protein